MEGWGTYLSWAVFGLIGAMFARLFLPGREPGGVPATVCLGIAGAFLANTVRAIFAAPMTTPVLEPDYPGLAMALVGGFTALSLVQFAIRPSHTPMTVKRARRAFARRGRAPHA